MIDRNLSGPKGNGGKFIESARFPWSSRGKEYWRKKKGARKRRGKEAYANAARVRLQTALHGTIVSNTVKQ